MPKINRIGEVHKMNNGQLAKIIDYENKNNITIKFEDGTILNKIRYNAFKRGSVKNPYLPTKYGIGYIGEESTVDCEGQLLKSYIVWNNMLSRCYNIKNKRYKDYGEQGVIVCKEWHNYTNFKKWYDEHYYELENEIVDLDKDILIEDNKVYSPETCIFVPKRINCLFRNHKKENSLPKGVYFQDGRYRCQIRIEGKTKHLGYYNTIEEASNVYLKAQKEEMKRTADVYKDKIPKKLYDRLIEIYNKIN